MEKIQRIKHTFFVLNPSFFLAVSIICVMVLAQVSMAIEDDIHPEVASVKQGVKTANGSSAMVVTANAYATDAATAILLKGGSAVDAAIAAQLVLNLVEPQASGIGGGGFLLHYDKKKRKLTHFNGRETAPLAVNEDFFLIEKNKPMPFFDAVVGGYAVGVPGIIAMLNNAHKLYGKLPWKTLFEPAIALSKKGFMISERLHSSLQALKQSPKGISNETLRAYFYQENGNPKPIGSLLKNPALAKTLTLIANKGADYFYKSDLPKNIVQAVRHDPVKKGVLSEKDFSLYKSPVESPLCKTIADYTFCGSPPPSSGPFTVIETLNILTKTPEFYGLRYDSAAFYHRFIEASKLAFADRNKFMADPKFVKIPLKPLLSESFQARRTKQLPLLKASDLVRKAGVIEDADYVRVKSPNMPSTTHLSIIDPQGNIVSMTSSIEHAFGSRIMVDGFILNNQLTDFSFTPKNIDDSKIANRIEPQKRPRSSMAPMIIFDKANNPLLIIGSPGGSWIIPYVAKTIAQHLFLDATLEDAIDSSHISNPNRLEATVEDDTPQALKNALIKLGHEIQERPLTSGIHAIRIEKGRLLGVADSRREGTAKGF